jgi:hypothetical protein
MQEQAGPDDDAAVGYVEVGPVVVNDVDFEEVDDVVVADAVVEVADRSAEDEGEGDRGGVEITASAPEHARYDDYSDDRERDEPVANGVGRDESANMLKAAPVLRTWVMRKTPGMTVWPGRWECGERSRALVSRSSKDHKRLR